MARTHTLVYAEPHSQNDDADSSLFIRYAFIDVDVRVVCNTSAPDLAPLNLYVVQTASGGYHHLTTASTQGNAYATSNGYKLLGVQGYVYTTEPADGGVPLEM